MAQFFLAALAVQGAATPLCPAICKASDNSDWPCRSSGYHSNDCVVSTTASSHRGANLVDINVAAINPYSGGLGDLMTMVEPSIAQATQEIENSNLLPGYRLNVHLVDSKCSVSDATFAAQASMSTGPKKHVLLSDSCSEACAAVNDAARFFQVFQVGPGCVSPRLRDSERYPFFTRMAPSTYYNTVAIYELIKFLSFKRVGVIYGYRDITHAARDLFLGFVDQDKRSGAYQWTILTTLRIRNLDDAKFAVKETHKADARINFMALYEPEAAMVLCQASKIGLQPPDYNYFVTTGWWNEQWIRLTANSADCPCSTTELHQASYGLIAADRGPMLQTDEVHSLSGRRLRDIHDEYSLLCNAFGNGIGTCNHQWAGYFYDGMWLIAKILDTYLIQQNNSFSNMGSFESRQALYNLSLALDFDGLTGRVHQWRAVGEVDRAGMVLLRQATGTPEKAFSELAYHSAEGFQFQDNLLWSSDGSKKVLCAGAECQFQSGWMPVDGVDQCAPGEVWSKVLGCSQCDPGTFSSDGHGQCQPCPFGTYGNESGMAKCAPCAPGTANPLTGMTACIPCLAGHFINTSGELLCFQCPMGQYAAQNGQPECTVCPPGRTTNFEGATDEELCRCDGNLFQGTCVQCPSGTRFELGACVTCQGLEICQSGRVVGYRSSDAQWYATIEMASLQCALTQEIARRFLLLASGLEADHQKLHTSMNQFDSQLHSLRHGSDDETILAPPNDEVQQAVEALNRDWSSFQALLTNNLGSVDQAEAVVAPVAQLNLEVLVRSEVVLAQLLEASQQAGAASKGLLAEITERQKTLIERFSKEVLLISLGHEISSTRRVLGHMADLFEASQDAIIFGVDSVGLPHLDQMCTMRQMRDVTYYASQVIPMVREVVNAESNLESQATAKRIALELSTLTQPFFETMMEAEQLLENSSQSCQVDITPGEWKSLLDASAEVRCRCEMGFLYFLQIINGVEVDASKVKLTVQVSSEHSELRKLVQGSRMDGIPTPPRQDIMDNMLLALDAWSRMESLLSAAAELAQLPSGHVARTVRMREEFEHRMDLVLIEEAANASGVEMEGIPLTTVDMLHMQQMRLSRMSSEAHLVLYGYKPDVHREMLNATVEDVLQMSQQLILGAPGTAMQPIPSLCITQDVADVMTIYGQVEEASYAVANGNKEEAVRLIELIPKGAEGMGKLMKDVEDFYQGRVGHNCSRSLTTEQWLQLMCEVVRLACLGEELASPGSNQTEAKVELRASLMRLQIGSASPAVPAPANKELYQQVMEVLTPLVESLEVGGLVAAAQAQLDRYTQEGLQVDPAWPGERLKVFLWQKVVAMEVFREQMGAIDEGRIDQFQAAHDRLKDGGGGLTALAQSESLEAWTAIDGHWRRFKEVETLQSSRAKARRDELLSALDNAVSVFAVPDVHNDRATVPWGYYVVYPVLGLLVLCCCAGACCLGRQSAKEKRAQRAAKGGAEGQEGP